jgi:formylglycine-generating enzyme required for sulfatase activity
MLLGLAIGMACAAASTSATVSIPAGEYPALERLPADAGASRLWKSVEAFSLDRHPVTGSQFAAFVTEAPFWRRSRISRLYADEHYLEGWNDDLHPPQNGLGQPVVQVSWFAARAYCHSRNADLPTNDQWELAAFDHGRSREEVRSRILEWYGRPSGGRTSSPLPPNGYGVSDLFGVIWEWTLDFNTPTGGTDQEFCGAGALGGADPDDYATFMRLSFRQSLKAAYTIATLGFRCARASP